MKRLRSEEERSCVKRHMTLEEILNKVDEKDRAMKFKALMDCNKRLYIEVSVFGDKPLAVNVGHSAFAYYCCIVRDNTWQGVANILKTYIIRQNKLEEKLH